MAAAWMILAVLASIYFYITNRSLKKADRIIAQREVDAKLTEITKTIEKDVVDDTDQQLADRINSRYKPNNTAE